jgi:hypothetical protein
LFIKPWSDAAIHAESADLAGRLFRNRISTFVDTAQGYPSKVWQSGNRSFVGHPNNEALLTD